jgi:hypothetical protein
LGGNIISFIINYYTFMELSLKQIFNLSRVLIIAVFTALFLSSCATIFNGDSDDVRFTSDPKSAKVYINGHFLGNTPITLPLPTGSSYMIEFKKQGYETKTAFINNSVGAGWVVLDILGGLIPVLIDAATGNWYGLDQDHVNAMLEKQLEQGKHLEKDGPSKPTSTK